MTCRDAIALLADYLEATVGVGDVLELEAHLAGCDECQAYLNTYRKTRELVAGAARVEMPVEMRRRLRSFLISTLSGA